jgi:hypothetical protein
VFKSRIPCSETVQSFAMWGEAVKLQVLDRVYEFDVESTSAQEMVDAVNDLLMNTEYIYSHLVADGMEVYEELGCYLSRIDGGGPQEVVVIVQTKDALYRDVIDSTYQYVVSATPKIAELSQEFYEGGTSHTWCSLQDFIEGLQWILSSYSTLTATHGLSFMVEDNLWRDYSEGINQLKSLIPELMDAVENQDQVLLADLLLYEIHPLFEDMQSLLEQITGSRGEAHAH